MRRVTTNVSQFGPLARQEQLLDEFERSGLSGAKFAARTDLKYPIPTVRWLEAVVGPAASPGIDLPLTVQLPGGARLELTSAQQLPLAVELLRALARPSTPC